MARKKYQNKNCLACGISFYRNVASAKYCSVKCSRALPISEETRKKMSRSHANSHLQTDLTGQKFGSLLAVERIAETRKRTRYICLCDCGNTISVEGSKIKNSSKSDCGCIEKERSFHNLGLPDNCAAVNAVIGRYKGGARHRGYEYALTKEQAEKLLNGNCYYCGVEPSSFKKGEGSKKGFYYNGIDRLDNKQGYLEENCVSCCKTCNYKKGAQHKNDFLLWIKSIYENMMLDKQLKNAA